MRFLFLIPILILVGCQSTDIAKNPPVQLSERQKTLPPLAKPLPKGIKWSGLLVVATERGVAQNACVRQLDEVLNAIEVRDAIQFESDESDV